MVWWWALWVGCPAEMLGIPLPHAGLDGVSMDDLVRDTARLSRGLAAQDSAAGAADRLAFLTERWAQMGLTAEADGRCGSRRGTGPELVVVDTDAPIPGDAHTWAAAAAVISLAKTMHGRADDPRGVWFCAGEAPLGGAATLRFGPLGGADGVWTDTVGGARVADGVVGPVGDLDHRKVEAAVRAAYPRLVAGLLPAG